MSGGGTLTRVASVTYTYTTRSLQNVCPSALTTPLPCFTYRSRHRDRVVRRGIGMTIESDFYATEAGRQHFSDQLTSIRYCVQETCNFDAIFSVSTT